jgi:hypothetical protein
MEGCKADCFKDGTAIRPIASPLKLVWSYFHVGHSGSCNLELRQFNPCPCGCDRLTANPPANKDHGPSFIPKPQEPKPVMVKLSWWDRVKQRVCQWLCH